MRVDAIGISPSRGWSYYSNHINNSKANKVPDANTTNSDKETTHVADNNFGQTSFVKYVDTYEPAQSTDTSNTLTYDRTGNISSRENNVVLNNESINSMDSVIDQIDLTNVKTSSIKGKDSSLQIQNENAKTQQKNVEKDAKFIVESTKVDNSGISSSNPYNIYATIGSMANVSSQYVGSFLNAVV